MIGKCINDVQSAFVLGQSISNNVLLAYELLDTLKKKRIGERGFLTIKFDMSKAYNRVEWGFI